MRRPETEPMTAAARRRLHERMDVLPHFADDERVMEQPTSTARVIQLLKETGKPLSRDEIRQEFVERGWADPDWQTPSAAIRMAIRRALERPEVVEVGGLYEFRDLDVKNKEHEGGHP